MIRAYAIQEPALEAALISNKYTQDDIVVLWKTLKIVSMIWVDTERKFSLQDFLGYCGFTYEQYQKVLLTGPGSEDYLTLEFCILEHLRDQARCASDESDPEEYWPDWVKEEKAKIIADLISMTW